MKFAFGVYVALAVSVLGEPAAHALFAIAPSAPFAGPETIVIVSSQVCASDPESGTDTALSSFVVAEAGLATGAVFGGAAMRSTTVCAVHSPELPVVTLAALADAPLACAAVYAAACRVARLLLPRSQISVPVPAKGVSSEFFSWPKNLSTWSPTTAEALGAVGLPELLPVSSATARIGFAVSTPLKTMTPPDAPFPIPEPPEQLVRNSQSWDPLADGVVLTNVSWTYTPDPRTVRSIDVQPVGGQMRPAPRSLCTTTWAIATPLAGIAGTLSVSRCAAEAFAELPLFEFEEDAPWAMLSLNVHSASPDTSPVAVTAYVATKCSGRRNS